MKVVSKAGVVQVFVNGVLTMTGTMTLPSNAFVGFTGANGSAGSQNNFVNDFSMTDS